jgi:cardiolipin synthase
MIDQAIVYVGSMNISACHLTPKMLGGQNWRDTAAKITGANVADLQAAFEASWNHIPIQERVKEIFRHVNTNPVFRLNTNWHRRRILYKNLLRRIANCKNRIWITNAYFVPDTFLLNKLKEAAKSGVDVRILLPNKSDIFIMPWASSIFYAKLLETGVRIFEYLPSVLHAKTLILDDWMSVGSSNLNHRSLLHDLEVDVNIRLVESKKIIAQQFLNDLQHSQEINLKDWWKRPWYQRFIGRLALYLKYMI